MQHNMQNNMQGGMQMNAQPWQQQNAAMGGTPQNMGAMQPNMPNAAPGNIPPWPQGGMQPNMQPQMQGGMMGMGGNMYQAAPPAPQMGNDKKPMKRWQILLIIISVILAGAYLYHILAPVASPYGEITIGAQSNRYAGDALIIRNEVAYDAEGVTSIDYKAEEGTVVRRGSPICNVYSSGYSTREMVNLQSYRDQIKNYQLTLEKSETTYDAKKEDLKRDVLTRAREFRNMVFGTKGSLLNHEKLLETSITARQNYLKRKYGSEQRLSRLYDDEQSQQQRISSWTKQSIATEESLVSFYCDGYEYLLTTSNYAEHSPSDVRKMIGGWKPERSAEQKGKTTIYRTIRDGEWYVLMLIKNDSWNPTENQVLDLVLDGNESERVNATVVSFTRSGSQLLVRLRVQGSVLPVLYNRTSQAEIGDYVENLCVPSKAIYHQDNMTGVVIVDGQNKLFIPVNIIERVGDDVYIESVHPNMLHAGQMIVLF